MSLRSTIASYVDGNNLVMSYPYDGVYKRGSDNGTMFTSEYYILLKRVGELLPTDKIEFMTKMSQCIVDNTLHRAPDDLSPDVTDNYHGVLAACKQLGVKSIPWMIIKHPWQVLRLGQAQILAMAWAGTGLPAFLFFPFFVYSALVIATSCINVDAGDSDSRRLSWLLIQATAGSSVLCWLASKLWYRRLFKTYPRGMQDVYDLYYQPKGVHPFTVFMNKGL
jgi:hypothetical protein